jgi:DNA recombination protein RmuC
MFANGPELILLLAFVIMTLASIVFGIWQARRARVFSDQSQELRANLHELEVELKHSDLRLNDYRAQGAALQLAARAEFENLARQIIQSEGLHFQQTSEKNLEQLLGPLKERLKDFEKRVETSYENEGKERHLLKAELERLILSSDRMSLETTQLTQALKGDNKLQGDWGELVLENILSSSGLREGLEYTKQTSLLDDQGDRFRPDILVHLPDEKQIIVDSKVSLKSYQAYSSATTDVERDLHLRAHVRSISAHIDELAEKHYPKLRGLRTPEFVFLFTPIETAYLLAIKHDPEISHRAWKRGVAIVTATTLFTSLRTVASIWKLEHQNRNAQEIAQEAGRLYDKFVGFYEDFEKLGRTFENGLAQYEDARRKLKDGPGNVFRKIELLRELGAAPSKRIKAELLES